MPTPAAPATDDAPAAAANTTSMSSMAVGIRIRPFNARERERGDVLVWEPNEDASSMTVPEEARELLKLKKTPNLPNYGTGSVFAPGCSTNDIYEAVGRRVVEGSLRGVNGTVLAYGQTSSGKTHTMLGDQTHPGVVLLAVRDVFKHISEDEEREYLLRVSMCEIYNEVVGDLLLKGNTRLGVFTKPGGRDVIIKGITEEIVTSAEQVWGLLDRGFENRSVSGTDMNAVSSRSHTVIRVVIESRKIGAGKKDKVRVSTLNMVDLAGSERMSQAKTRGTRLKEGININTSLLTLGTVIKKLMSQGATTAAGRKRHKEHIPYRNSMLTRVLAKSLGGSAQTAVICTLAPSHEYYQDSRITLAFAGNACKVRVKARVNEVQGKSAMLGAHEEEMAKLKEQLKASAAMGLQIGPDGAVMQQVVGPDGSVMLVPSPPHVAGGAGSGTGLCGFVSRADCEAAALKAAEEKTAELRQVYEDKIKHLQSLILRKESDNNAAAAAVGDGNQSADVGSAGAGVAGFVKKTGLKYNRRASWSNQYWTKKLHATRQSLCQTNRSQDFTSFLEGIGLSRKDVVARQEQRRAAEAENGGVNEDDEDEDDVATNRDSSASVDSVGSAEDDSGEMWTLATAMEEIAYLRGRVRAEEQDRFDAEDELWQLRIDLQLLTEGTGIEDKTSEELDEIQKIHEEGLVHVVNERNRVRNQRKMREMAQENERLRQELAQAQQVSEGKASPRAFAALQVREQCLAEELKREREMRVQIERQREEDNARTLEEFEQLKHQAAKQEKKIRAYHQLDLMKRGLEHRSGNMTADDDSEMEDEEEQAEYSHFDDANMHQPGTENDGRISNLSDDDGDRDVGAAAAPAKFKQQATPKKATPIKKPSGIRTPARRLLHTSGGAPKDSPFALAFGRT